MKDNLNCHFVTRSITKEWEHESGLLYYYDYGTKKVKKFTSKKLFAVNNLNSNSIEILLNKYVETPLINAKNRLLKMENVNIQKWEEYRSLYLYFMIQAGRYSKYLNLKSKESEVNNQEHHLDTLLKNENYLDSFVKIDMDKYNIAIVSVPNDQIIFFPEAGFFQIPVKDSLCASGFTFGYALPITPRLAFIKVIMPPENCT